MPPRGTIWPLDEHTRGKHAVLRAYLNAWLPILGMTHGRIVFIDGFAGPGAYSGGEDGSPIIALKALVEHASKSKINAEIVYLFIEEDAARAAHLSRLVDAMRSTLPPKVLVEVHTGRFHETMSTLLDGLEIRRQNLAPSFIMLDPFGVSNLPMSLIARILKNPRSEVYISFMYEWINRFRKSPEFGPHLDELFGTDVWRRAEAVADPEARKAALYQRYEDQLRAAGAKHVVHFELYDQGRLVYAIFFATQHAKGCNTMKDAIWKAAPAGDYQFRGGSGGQLSLLGGDLRPFERELQTVFAQAGIVTIGELEDWAKSDRTSFHVGHLRKALKSLETAGAIKVDPASRVKRGTYPPGTKLRFTAP